MICLAIDTTGRHCSISLYDCDADNILFAVMDDLGRGHAEHLLSSIERALASSGVRFNEISKIVTTTGPGSFTGVRVCLSSARAFGLALGIPVVGLSVLEVLSTVAEETDPKRPIVTVLDARRSQVYVRWPAALVRKGEETQTISSLDEIVSRIGTECIDLCGGAAELVAAELGDQWRGAIIHTFDSVPVEVLATMGACADPRFHEPEPLYLRKADAKPQRGFTSIQRI